MLVCVGDMGSDKQPCLDHSPETPRAVSSLHVADELACVCRSSVGMSDVKHVKYPVDALFAVRSHYRFPLFALSGYLK